MNYANHNLRTNLQEWMSRLSMANHQQFGHQLKYFFQNIDKNNQLLGLINDEKSAFPLIDKQFDEYFEGKYNGKQISYESEVEHAAFCYQILKYYFIKYSKYDIHNSTLFQRRGFEDTKNTFLEEFISPITYYLIDKLDKSNSTIFLLEKYKRRTEWFTKETLLVQYTSAIKNYEKIFEDDLRIFLFDQGIDYPFSTPSSASGRADIVGQIETDDPLIIEIKILDKEKGYGKGRIKEGFAQIVKYANDYNKQIGFLVLFNIDNLVINFKFEDSKRVFPPSLNFDNKTFYFIVINCYTGYKASKSGETKEITITMDELTKK